MDIYDESFHRNKCTLLICLYQRQYRKIRQQQQHCMWGHNRIEVAVTCTGRDKGGATWGFHFVLMSPRNRKSGQALEKLENSSRCSVNFDWFDVYRGKCLSNTHKKRKQYFSCAESIDSAFITRFTFKKLTID